MMRIGQKQRFVPLLLVIGLVLPASASVGKTGETAIAAVDAPKLTFSVGGCRSQERSAMPARGITTRIAQAKPQANSRQDKNLQVVVKEQTLSFSHPLHYVCCAELQLDHQIKNNVITVTETNVGKMCRCMCGYSINATLGKLPKGTYDLQIYGVKYVAKSGDAEIKPNLLFRRQVDVK